jgi:molecular chaperone DnaK (HSP70)
LKKAKYIIGIDLGTTNSTLSYVDTGSSDHKIQIFSIPQLIDEGVVKERSALPSFLYLPGEHELPPEAAALPWNKNIPHITGEFARMQGSRVPGHLVSSAKSWLCHNRVDREGPILPWGRDDAEKKVSPVEASAQYLRHMKESWNYAVASGDKKKLFEHQQIIITIPASFDESARELTAEAARLAGIKKFTMLEEPQAAFYAWISAHEEDWQEHTGQEGLILVCDVGGGTTDFTLISIKSDNGSPSFQRVAVGDHIMLGGDNMDLTLARDMEHAMAGSSGKFDFQQWLSATYQCRAAKEELLGGSQTASVSVSVLGKGRSVIGGARKAELAALQIKDTIIDGFFRKAEVGEELERGRMTGLQELGLPFESDTAIMKHLASFLKRHAADKELPQVTDALSGAQVVRPDILLFNGGVFKSPVIRDHAASIIRKWFSGEKWSLRILENKEFDQAVSIGAAYYGRVLRGQGRRISGGTGKAYYIAVETAQGKAEGETAPLTLVCIVPRGTEEGEEIHLTQPEFQVMTNSPVSFALYSSSYRAGDKTGDVIAAEKKEFLELPPVRTVMHYGKKTGSVRIPVSLGVRLNEFGTMDVWCESKKTPHRWKLAFQLRGETEEGRESIQKKTFEHTIDESAVVRAAELTEKAFLSSPRIPSEVTPENLIKKIEELFDLQRKDWPLFAIRKLWDALIKLKDRRTAAVMHEARWLSLAGFLLRPGFGYELDEVRIKEIWKVFLADLAHAKNGQCRSEWWILWRRTAGGFDSAKQDIIYRKIAPWLIPSKKKSKKLSASEISEMWMLAASLEDISPDVKTKLGNQLMKELKAPKGRSQDQYFWALSRIGERSPFHGSIDKVVPKENSEAWIEALLKNTQPLSRHAGYAIAQLSRKTGDRTRDINEDIRSRVIEALSPHTWAEHLLKQIKDVIALEREDEKEIFGESLPAGLYIENKIF